MPDMENISVKIQSNKKKIIYDICKKENVTLSIIIRKFLDQIVENDSTRFDINNINTTTSITDNKLETILSTIHKDNSSIIGILKAQLNEKDSQLKVKDKLIENMQILMKENQQLLKEEQSKNVLLLDNKNNTNKTSWFPFFKNKNV